MGQGILRNRHQAVLDLYRPTLLRDIHYSGDSHLLDDALRCIGIDESDRALQTNARLLDRIYDWMEKEYRVEYIYISEFLEQFVFPNEKLVALTQTRLSASVSDLITIDGDQLTVYEVKTEHDSLSRLSRQIDSYLSVFDRMYVVAHESMYDSVLEKIGGRPVGVYTVTDSGRFYKMRPAPLKVWYDDERPTYLRLASTYCSLERIVYMYYGEIPLVLSREENLTRLKKLFLAIPFLDRKRLVVQDMRRRAVRTGHETEVPRSLRALYYLYADRYDTDTEWTRLERWLGLTRYQDESIYSLEDEKR